MKITLTYSALTKLHPCHNPVGVWGGSLDAQQARSLGATFSDILWVSHKLSKKNGKLKRVLHFFAADCAAKVLHLYEKDGESCAPRRAIEAARAADADAAYAAAADAYAADAAYAAHAAAHAYAYAYAAHAAADAAEQEWQFDRLVAWLSEEEPEPWPLPAIKK